MFNKVDDTYKRSDAHIHLTELGEPFFAKKRYDMFEDYYNYFTTSNIKTAFVVYEDSRTFNALKNFCSDLDIVLKGFYWLRGFSDEQIQAIPDDAEALKLESYIDGINPLDLSPILDEDEQDRPVYIHCGELKSALSNPKKVEQLAELYPNNNFIIGHGGAYAPPITQTKYIKNDIVNLVSSAVEVAINNPNIKLETSILDCNIKREIIVKNIEELKYKLMLGTDIPLRIGDVLTGMPFSVPKNIQNLQPIILSQEQLLLNDGVPQDIIKQIYQNTIDFF